MKINNKNKISTICLILIIVIIIVSAIVIIVSPWDFDDIVSEKYQAPTLRHPFGTDYLGRDILVRLAVAWLVSLSLAVLSIFTGMLVGCIYGICAGYNGGLVEHIMVLVLDIMQCIPEMLIALFLMVVMNAQNANSTWSSIIGLFITLSIVSWPIMARIAKNETKVVRQKEFITYAKVKGAGLSHMVFFHILPTIRGQLITVMAQRIPKVILIEAFLSYIGIGIQPPFPSLGKMINDGVSVIRYAPHVILFPTFAIVIMVMLFNVLCEKFR